MYATDAQLRVNKLNNGQIVQKDFFVAPMDHLSISTCETVSQFNDNLRTQCNEEKEYQGIRTVKNI